MEEQRAGVSEEWVLAEAARRRDVASLGSVLAAQQRWLTRYVARRVPADVRAVIGIEDVVQETFLHALRHAREFLPDGEGSLRRWLATLANNRLCDFVRAQRRLKRGGAVGHSSEEEQGAAGASFFPDDALHGLEDRAALAAALETLREDYRDAIRLRYLAGLGLSEVALLIGRSPGAVAMLCHRAIKQLRRALSPAAAP
jgi:RNA polymerase sigma-70 factor (ECF subfamily)